MWVNRRVRVPGIIAPHNQDRSYPPPPTQNKRFVLAFLGGVWRYFLRPGKNLRGYGKWAVVTGATDGIGKAFCEELAKKKINLVLVSRTESKLKELSSALESKYKVSSPARQMLLIPISARACRTNSHMACATGPDALCCS